MYNVKNYKCKKCHSVFLANTKSRCLECQSEMYEIEYEYDREQKEEKNG